MMAHMEKTYVIEWMPKIGVLKRRSQKLFTREEAQNLAEELNEEHPKILHEAYNLSSDLPLNAETVALDNESAIIRDINFAPVDPFNLPLKEVALG
jgi:hypothetical protein